MLYFTEKESCIYAESGVSQTPNLSDIREKAYEEDMTSGWDTCMLLHFEEGSEISI